MVNKLADIPPPVWQTAAGRLNQIGVFADEGRTLPGLPTLCKELTEFESMVRSNGYTGGALEIDEIEQPKNGVNFVIFDQAKIGNVRSAAMAWEKEYRDRWHARVEDRVRDWLQRLQALKAMMQRWLPNSMSIVDLHPTAMHEELMSKFDVPPAQMPTFEVRDGTRRIMRVQPRGLWVLGANGRVDLITATASYILVDQSEPLSHAPDWHYYASANKRQSTPLDETRFLSLLS